MDGETCTAKGGNVFAKKFSYCAVDVQYKGLSIGIKYHNFDLLQYEPVNQNLISASEKSATIGKHKEGFTNFRLYVEVV